MKSLLTSIIVLLLICTGFAQQPQWRELPDAPFESTSRFEDCFFINDSTGWIIHIDGRVYKTSDGGQSWAMIYSREPNDVNFRCINFISEETGFIGDIFREFNADSSVLYKTTDSGFSWSVVELPDPVPDGLCGLFSLSESFIYGVGRYYGSPVFIKSEDGGLNWLSISLDTLARGLVDLYFISTETGFAAGSVNQSGIRGAIFKTNDGGETWETAAVSSLTGISSWKISFPTSSTGYISFQGGGNDVLIFKTTNAGINWSEITYTLPDIFSAQGIGFADSLNGWISGFTLTDKTYQTTDGGLSWFEDDFGKIINRFRFLSDTLAYAVGQTVYKYSTMPVTNINTYVEPGLPDAYTLEQNYPNPFNPATKISWQSPIGSHQTIKVFNVLGREVATLVDEFRDAGSYEVEFHPESGIRELASGVYFYQLKSGGFVETKKMLLVR